MNRLTLRRSMAVVLPMLSAVGLLKVTQAAGRDRPLPDWPLVRDVVRRHFETLADYRPDDLVCVSEVEPLFQQLRLMGWRVAERRSIMRRVLRDRVWIVGLLKSPAGKEFMRKISAFPGAYDRLCRLMVRRAGRELVVNGVAGVGLRATGPELVAYLRTGRGGPAWEQVLGKTAVEAAFSKPTSRIFTAADLLEQLGRSHSAAAAALDPPAAEHVESM